MLLKQALRFQRESSIAFVGAGGKSSSMFELARELDGPVFVAATTHLALDQAKLADQHISITDANVEESFFEPYQSGITLFTGGMITEPARLCGLNNAIINCLHQYAQKKGIPLLIEADGSKRLPIKAPAAHEPVLPPWVDQVVVCAGLSGLYKPLNSTYAHRPEMIAEITGLQLNETIGPKELVRLLTHPQGGLRRIPPNARRVAFLNQADTPEMQAIAASIGADLLKAYDAVAIAQLRPSAPETQAPIIHSVIEPRAGILLAAGEARRFGSPKLLVPWDGKPLVRHIAEIALASNLDWLGVVTGAYDQPVRDALEGLPVHWIYNPDWREGLSASVKTAIRHLSPKFGSATFLMGDQPFLSTRIIDALLEKHAQTMAPVVAPLVEDQRTNPVLFDRSTWEQFAQISGDQGGRALFSKFPVTWIEWQDSNLKIDIDTPQDYELHHP